MDINTIHKLLKTIRMKNQEIKPKKLIRNLITKKLKEGEWETITDQDELNRLYAIKVREELAEIQASEHKDIMEFVDLIQVAFSFAKQNGFTHEQLSVALIEKSVEKGSFGRIALNNLNPFNPSNRLYFNQVFPNDIDLNKLSKLLAFSDRYEISVQFWPDQFVVYIAKDGVDLIDFGSDFNIAIDDSINYLNRINSIKP